MVLSRLSKNSANVKWNETFKTLKVTLLDCANENCHSLDWRRFPTNFGVFGKLKCPSPREFTI